MLPAAVSLLLAEDRIEFSVVLEGKRPQKYALYKINVTQIPNISARYSLIVKGMVLTRFYGWDIISLGNLQTCKGRVTIMYEITNYVNIAL